MKYLYRKQWLRECQSCLASRTINESPRVTIFSLTWKIIWNPISNTLMSRAYRRYNVMKLTKLGTEWGKSLFYSPLEWILKIYFWEQAWKESKNEDTVKYAKVGCGSWQDITRVAVGRNYLNKIPLNPRRLPFFCLNFHGLAANKWGEIWKVIGKAQSDRQPLIRKGDMKVTVL